MLSVAGGPGSTYPLCWLTKMFINKNLEGGTCSNSFPSSLYRFVAAKVYSNYFLQQEKGKEMPTVCCAIHVLDEVWEWCGVVWEWSGVV